MCSGLVVSGRTYRRGTVDSFFFFHTGEFFKKFIQCPLKVGFVECTQPFVGEGEFVYANL